jgi:quercetin dioxygenase-like cupin family protein
MPGVVIEGELDFWIEGHEPRVLRRGDVAVVPSWVAHRAVAGPDGCMQLDVFQPPRSPVLDALRAAAEKDDESR